LKAASGRYLTARKERKTTAGSLKQPSAGEKHAFGHMRIFDLGVFWILHFSIVIA
jgi:hypothetical protein